ncbi:alcohol dehydrogenase catalytic domain-containing protein [Bifidobacterium simiarum]|uniref:alcohol dehydrogenase catalytic domain-containing protein n=1 Tax=Bifidobacterium simiarum TaxID=2045441 RepID=UPI001BDD80F7|nr:alcohol dehydrogenase catalytic domain-containing protein [Bifidobacterium simiarum]MBT1167047.1 alcohol dehydrogenase catalytic domain-containing protein [Bifidobacterium simiarum]
MEWVETPIPRPKPGEALIRVLACGVCRTDLHVSEGDLPVHLRHVTPGHEIVGEIVALGGEGSGSTSESYGSAGYGSGASGSRFPGSGHHSSGSSYNAFGEPDSSDRFRVGERVGVAWLRHTCGYCEFCRAGKENLCPNSRYTGWDENGGYAEYTVAPVDYLYSLEGLLPPSQSRPSRRHSNAVSSIGPRYTVETVAPLLCAGIIGYRALRRTGLLDGVSAHEITARSTTLSVPSLPKSIDVPQLRRGGAGNGAGSGSDLGAGSGANARHGRHGGPGGFGGLGGGTDHLGYSGYPSDISTPTHISTSPAAQHIASNLGHTPVLGLYGFGGSAHITAQVALALGMRVHVLTRGEEARNLAIELGCASAAGAYDMPPEPLDAAIIFAPVGEIIPPALEALRPGGVLSLAGIHMSDVPALNYERHLFHEKEIRSVESNTREDGREFLAFAAAHFIAIDAHPYPLAEAQRALQDLKAGRFAGAAVLVNK